MEVGCKNCQNLEHDDVTGFDVCPVWRSCGRGTLFIPKGESVEQESENEVT